MMVEPNNDKSHPEMKPHQREVGKPQNPEEIECQLAQNEYEDNNNNSHHSNNHTIDDEQVAEHVVEKIIRPGEWKRTQREFIKEKLMFAMNQSPGRNRISSAVCRIWNQREIKCNLDKMKME